MTHIFNKKLVDMFKTSCKFFISCCNDSSNQNVSHGHLLNWMLPKDTLAI